MTTPEPSTMPAVSVEAAMRETADGAIMIDVREQDEWDSGHAPGARLVALSTLQERLSELPRDTRFLVVCHSGGRSMRATVLLRAEGYDAVNVEGGMAAWAAAGGPILSDSHTANADED